MTGSKPRYAICFEGDGELTRSLIERMLEVDAVHITADWQIADTNDANLIIGNLSSSDDAGRPLHDVGLQLNGEIKLLSAGLPKSFRLMQFIEMLNNAECHFETESEAQSISMPLPVGCNWVEFSQFLREVIAGDAGHGLANIDIDGKFSACVDLEKKNYTRIDNFTNRISPRSSISYTIVEGNTSNITPLSKVTIPLENLLWLSGLMASSGSAAPWLPEGPLYTLTKWPNFSILNHNMKMIEMAARLTKMPMSIEQLALELKTSEASVYSFMNAVSLFGFCKSAEVANHQAQPHRASGNVQSSGGENTQHNVSSLIDKLKLHLGKAG